MACACWVLFSLVDMLMSGRGVRGKERRTASARFEKCVVGQIYCICQV